MTVEAVFEIFWEVEALCLEAEEMGEAEEAEERQDWSE